MQLPKMQYLPHGATKIAALACTSQLDTLRFGTQAPNFHWPLYMSPNRSILNRKQNEIANACILELAAFEAIKVLCGVALLNASSSVAKR